ncbi:hypothetical protein [Thermosulfuriphilus sp.]
MSREPEEIWCKVLTENLRPALMGQLIQGFIHNLSGPLQILGMQLEFLGLLRQQKNQLLQRLLSQTSLDPQSTEKLKKILEGEQERLANVVDQIERINQLLSAFSLKTNLDRTFIELNDFVREEITFWEANLFFKHEVKKDLRLHPSGVMVKTVYPILRGAVDLVLNWIIEHGLSKDETKIVTFETRPEPSLAISYLGLSLPPILPFKEIIKEGRIEALNLALARDLFSELGSVELKGNQAIFRFH